MQENKILTLDQIQTMSTEELINSYKNGYNLSEKTEITEITSLQSQLSTTEIKSLQPCDHYTLTDAGIIVLAIGISTVIITGLTYSMIRREKEKLIKEFKDTISSSVQKAGLVEKLIPLAERIGQRFMEPKQS